MMRASANSRVLVIGYGSTLRGDDGVGRYVADTIGRQGRPQVEVVSVTQLLPEFAGPVANARAVIFVDACCDDALETTQIRELVIEPVSAGQTHFAGPTDILRLSRSCYGRVPRAWLVSVPAKRFDISGELSAAVRRHTETAVAIVGKLIDEALCTSGVMELGLPFGEIYSSPTEGIRHA
jgi:hydrogenase maturation protease